MRRYSGDRFEVASAGLQPTTVDPLTREVLSEVGIDPTGLHSKSSSEFLGKVAVKHAIIVCTPSEFDCPRIYPFALQTESWPFDDPAQAKGLSEMKLAAFRNARDQIDKKIRTWLEANGDFGDRAPS